ncbi:MAG: hypothetical protein IJO47_05155, partial [Clostridia bacterium]|nr:hypothetical protein [Clostridia bacterium]
NPLIIHGVVDEDGNSTAKDLCDVSGGIYVFRPIGTVGSVSLIVTKDGHQLADGFEVVWKNADGVVQPSTMGENGTVTFKPHATDLEFTYQITLTDDELLANYYIPELKTVTSTEAAQNITETLEAIPSATFTVNAPSGALVKLTQNINGVVTVSEKTVEGSSVSFEAKKAYTEITVSLNGYYTEYAVISEENIKTDEANTVEITMTALPAVSVPLNATSIIDGETELIDVTGFDFTVKNDETSVKVRLEGNMLYPDEEIAADTILTIAFESEGDLIAPKPVSFTFSDEDVDVQFKKRGHIEMTVSNWTNVDADGFLLWIFDLESGDLVEAYDMFYGICETDPLEAGKYNIVAIDRSVGIESVPNVSALEKFGLENKQHYYQKATAVSDGIVTDLGAIDVPDYEEFGGALYVDMFEYANFESTVIEPTIGQNFILTLDYKLNDTYSSTAEKEIIVQLPNGTYVNACYTPEGTGSFRYDEEDSFLTVTTTVNEGQIYLSLTGREANYYSTAVASAKIGAYTAKPVSFDLPIKDIYIEAYDVTNGKLFDREITVYTAPFANVMLYVNGKPYQKANSNNELYDGGEPVSSGGLGIAKFTVSLPGPATSGTRWKLTAKATVYDKDSNNYITYESAGEKIINYYIDPFGVVISTQYPWCAQADAAGASVNYSSVQRGVQSYWMTRCPYYAWNAGVNDGMGKYIKDGT